MSEISDSLLAFIDPYFSSGVHLAIAGGLTAAASICAVLRGECTESEACQWHTAKTETSYTRYFFLFPVFLCEHALIGTFSSFLLVVLSAYQQVRAQNAPVLSTDDEDNFDRAFNFFRPIIQGNTDTGKKFAGDDLNKTIMFLAQHAFEPSQPEERATLISKHGNPLESPPVALPGDSEEDSRGKAILKGVAIRKLMRTEDIVHIDGFVSDNLCGLRLRLKRGMLGVDRV